MRSLSRFFRWWALLTKRLLRRPGYLAVLLLVPLFALGLSLLSQEDSGAVTVALYLADPEDPVAAATAARLETGESVLRCERVFSEEEARARVRSGRADAAWLLDRDLTAKLRDYVRYSRGGCITVVEREENVFLRVSREKLFGSVYPELSFTLFQSFAENELGLGELTESELRTYYNSGFTAQELLRFRYLDGTEVETSGSYLTAPLRGILALLLLLGAMASGMYCYGDERAESFVWLAGWKRALLPVFSHLIAMLPAALAVLGALALSDAWLGLGRETLLLLCYLPGCALFCEILRLFCPREEQFGALIPILTLAILVFCPVFLSLRWALPVRALLPTGQYLTAALGAGSPGGMLGYLGVLALLYVPCVLLRRR